LPPTSSLGARCKLAYHHGNLREALLERAAEVVAERGVEGLSLRGLARDLGVSHSAPRAHFADRSALLAALARDGFRRALEYMDAEAEAAGPDPLARYRALGRGYVRFAVEDRAAFHAMNHPEVRASADEELHAARRAFNETLAEGVAAAQRAGWHPEASAEALLTFSTAAASGAAMLFSDPAWCEALAIESVESLADAVLDLVVHRTRLTAMDADADDSAPRPDPDEQRKIS